MGHGLVDEKELRFEVARLRGAARRRFRGDMVANRERAPMGKGHGNNGQPFDIETACYLKPVVAAYHRPTTRKLVIKAGVKTMKSFLLEMAALHHVCNSVGDATIYFGSGEVADDVSTTRILADFEGVPRYRELLRLVTSRFDTTMSAVKFPHKTFRLKPANLLNTQQVNLCFVGVQDAFVTGQTGMIDQAIERTTQYPDDKKIVLESQGGEVGFDFDRHYEDTDQGELYVTCPVCGSAHIFNWKVFDVREMTRGTGFVARPPLSVPSLDHAAWVAHHTPLLLAEGRRVAGFRRGPEELIKSVTGDYNEAVILRETHFECFHCGGIWRDDGESGPTRVALDRSSWYVSARPEALREHVGFNFPQWINRRLPWGKIMLEKLKRTKTAESTGNWEPIKQWWQKTAARTWDPEMMRPAQQTVSVGSYDPEQVMPDEHSRNMAVDCQEDADHKRQTGQSVTGWFWYVVRVFDKQGNSRQLARGFCKSFAAWIAVQKRWGVPNDRVVIDVRDWGAQIKMEAVRHHEVVKMDRPTMFFGGSEKLVTWYLFQAENMQKPFLHPREKQYRAWSPIQPELGKLLEEKTGKIRNIPLRRVRFNKVPIQLQLDALRSGAPGMARFEYLNRDQLRTPEGLADKLTQEMETGNRTYEKQMDAQYYDPLTHKYVELRPDDHYSWCEQALLVRVGMDGLLGQAAVFKDSEVTA